MQTVLEKIKQANNIALSTHKQCDGDGLGAAVATYHALKKMGKNPRLIFVDEVPSRYSFLETDSILEVYEENKTQMDDIELVLIFDTNDKRLVEPLYSQFEKTKAEIIFLDHHPLLENGPLPPEGSYIEVNAASTGEIAYDLIDKLNIDLDINISRAIYTSIAFDTQLFRYVKSSPKSHFICAKLLEFDFGAEQVHKYLFSNYTVGKLNFLSAILKNVEYVLDNKFAIVRVNKADLTKNNLEIDNSRDVIDMIMNIESLEAAVLLREEGPSQYKISLRSKGKLEVLAISEHFGGGGHLFASGALVKGTYDEIKEKIIEQVKKRI